MELWGPMMLDDILTVVNAEWVEPLGEVGMGSVYFTCKVQRADSAKLKNELTPKRCDRPMA